ncbi:hypothetical protein AAHC03_0999 [Spirometra sp. Aus1]
MRTAQQERLVVSYLVLLFKNWQKELVASKQQGNNPSENEVFEESVASKTGVLQRVGYPKVQVKRQSYNTQENSVPKSWRVLVSIKT